MTKDTITRLLTVKVLCIAPVYIGGYTVLVKSFAHLNRNFFLASLEEIGKFLQCRSSLRHLNLKMQF